MIGRRQFGMGLGGTILGLAGLVRGGDAVVPVRNRLAFGGAALLREIRTIELASGGRLGVAVRDTGDGRGFAWRGGERFPMCSTFKVLLAGLVLARIDRGEEWIDRALPVAASDIIDPSPATKRHVGASMTIEAMIEAILTLSDNGAANLLLATVGGPAAVTSFVRTLGDPATRLDRIEPALNEAGPRDPRDTTTPSAMLGNLAALLLGSALRPASRARLTGWMIACRTGDARLHAGLPAGWRIGDKTGTGDRGSSNDIAILWPPHGAPLLVSAYLTETQADPNRRNAALAAVGRAVAAVRG